MSMDKTYDHKNKEPKIYKYWEDLEVFPPEGSKKIRNKHGLKSNNEPYTVLMPPPNANAPLHCGHATYAIQDLMTRFKRMNGYDALYLPGTDHAGFETQVVYERHLKKEGKSRFDFDRETFFNNVLNFVKENSSVAINQLKMIGMSSDWNRLTFTLDPKAVGLVYDTFIQLHKDGMVYRDGYMVNYSTFHGTTFSDLETMYKDSVSPLYYVKYKVKDTNETITVATVRPETIYADVAIAVNPKDKRYKKLVGSIAINPLNGREMNVIADSYVDMEFGTGALKITPGHDMNDFKIGKSFGLEVISLIDLDGKMNSFAGECAGMFPKQARIKVSEILKEVGALEKIDESYQNRVLVDYKDELPIEPMVLPNWFIDMNVLAEKAITAIEKNEVKFNLPMWKRDTLRWVKEKKPWPISRQTVFGIRIPAWYSVIENPSMQVVFLDKSHNLVKGSISEVLKNHSLSEVKDGLQKVIAEESSTYVISKECPGDKYIQETDTFDTWFSSSQWPLTTTQYPEGDIYKKHFPTDFLDSGYEIMFFWIARMIMFSKYLTGKVPFKMVYFHGVVTDKFGKKMSKSKNNTVNPIEMIEKYGADALRMGILVGGNTEAKFSPFDENQVRGYRNFANKIWNIARYIEIKRSEIDTSQNIQSEEDIKLKNDLNRLIEIVTINIEKMKYKAAGEAFYEFIWDRLANDYLEKNRDRNDISYLETLTLALETAIKLAHPYMPFVTEAVWRELNPSREPLIVSTWPEVKS